MTNLEYIQNMDIDKLSKLIERDCCCNCCSYSGQNCSTQKNIKCLDGIKLWLSQEAKDEADY